MAIRLEVAQPLPFSFLGLKAEILGSRPPLEAQSDREGSSTEAMRTTELTHIASHGVMDTTEDLTEDASHPLTAPIQLE